MMTTRARWMVCGVGLSLGLVVAAACGGGDAQPGLRQRGGEPVERPDLNGEVAVNDTSVSPDGAVEDVVDDSGASDVPTDTLVGPGAPCEADNQCTTRHCLPSREGRTCAPACAGVGCPSGYECQILAGDAVCVDLSPTLCMPCQDHEDCGTENEGSRCLALGDEGRFCASRCGEGGAGCPDGFDCEGGACRPTSGVCLCSGLAVERGASTACSVEGPPGSGGAGERAVCSGERRCAAAGEPLTDCDATAPTAESCNGRDDDCDGKTDERPLDVDCGDYACGGEAGCLTTCAGDGDCRPGLGCADGRCGATGADGTECDKPGDCASGYCANGYCCARGEGGEPLCCAEDANCASLDEEGVCTSASINGCEGLALVGRCRASSCVLEQAPSPSACLGRTCRGAQCLGGSVFDGPHLCDFDGACVPTSDVTCDDGEVCTFDSCSAAVGCQTSPRSGATEAACYTFAAETRRVGVCQDGVTTCQNGSVSGCLGERGPSAELCNGRDDDCDKLVDDETEPLCFPYLCGGTAGCRTSCTSDAQCAAGNFCDEGKCVSTGADGATCEDDGECASGHCSQGVCCAAGLCCRGDDECGSLDDAICEMADRNGCQGTRVDGVCGVGNMCGEVVTVDDGICLGAACDEARCEGMSVVPAAACDAGGACVPTGPNDACSPYACSGGACLAQCAGDGDCSGGAKCKGGACVDLPDGAACSSAAECNSQRCNNGFCCKSGTCCGTNAACSGFGGVGVCLEAGSCKGERDAGVCGGDFSCRTEKVAAPEACLGQTCGSSSCVNLAGIGLVLEGVERKLCDVAGECKGVVSDCRDNEAYSYCTQASDVFSSCLGCAPRRSTCVVFDNPCFCE